MYTFSGIDSSGKTTQINLLLDYCKENNIEAFYQWGKGRATPVVMFLKSVFRRDRKMDAEQKKEYRAQVYSSKKKKFLLLSVSILDLWWYWGIYYRHLDRKHELLICDRYVWDTYIEFKTEFSEYNIDKWLIWKIAKMVAPKPDHSFMFIIPAVESFRRDNDKGDKDRYELDRKIEKVKKYQSLISQGKWDTVIDGMNSRESIFEKVKGIVFNDDTRNGRKGKHISNH